MKGGWWGSKWVASPPSDPRPGLRSKKKGGLVGCFSTFAVALCPIPVPLPLATHRPTSPHSEEIHCSAVDLNVGSRPTFHPPAYSPPSRQIHCGSWPTERRPGWERARLHGRRDRGWGAPVHKHLFLCRSLSVAAAPANPREASHG